MKSSPKVVVITLNWNGIKWIDLCLRSLYRLNYDNYEIVMVDNNSTDGSYDYVLKHYNEVNIIRNNENLGYSKGFNVGINYAMSLGADYVLLVNNDTWIGTNALKFLVETAETDEKIGFVTGKVLFLSERRTIQTTGRENDNLKLVGQHIGAGQIDKGQYDGIKDFDSVDDIFLLVKNRIIEELKGFLVIQLTH